MDDGAMNPSGRRITGLTRVPLRNWPIEIAIYFRDTRLVDRHQAQSCDHLEHMRTMRWCIPNSIHRIEGVGYVHLPRRKTLRLTGTNMGGISRYMGAHTGQA